MQTKQTIIVLRVPYGVVSYFLLLAGSHDQLLHSIPNKKRSTCDATSLALDVYMESL